MEGGDLSACGQVLARWAARCTGGTAAVFVPDERREPKLLAHSAGADHAGPLLSACRWLARQALVRRVTITASSDLIGKEEETEGRAGLVVAHPLGTGSKVPAVLAVAWPREEGDRVLGDHREVLATVARIGGALLNALAQRQEMAEAHSHAVQLLVTALEARFPWLSGHGSRTARLARGMALALGLGLPEAEEVYEAALLHDVGHLRADAWPRTRSCAGWPPSCVTTGSGGTGAATRTASAGRRYRWAPASWPRRRPSTPCCRSGRTGRPSASGKPWRR